jgi:hypothetical protein
MKHDLSVEVIINNFNYGRFLSAAIDSALAQTHPAVRVIVVDDGSTDESRAVISRYGERIVPVLKENGGQASALNAGFAHSAGDVVIFLDSDDVLLPHAASMVVDAFHQSPGAAKVQYRMEVIDGNGSRTGVLKPAPHLSMPSGDLRRHELALPFDLGWLPTSANAFPARILERILPVPENDFPVLADYYLVHLTPLFGSVVSLPVVAGQYRVHGANSYEQSWPRLDLEHVRKSVIHSAATRRHLERVADEIGLGRPRGGIVSVADIANRMISLRLDRPRHPLPDDTMPGLLGAGVRASRRRFDVSPLMRLAFVAWFASLAVAPRAGARWLAEQMLFPERRPRLSRLLGALQTAPPESRSRP